MWYRQCDRVQKRLLTKPKLTFTKAVTIAWAVELAEKGSKELQSSGRGPPKDIHKFSHLLNFKKSSQKHEDVSEDKSVGTCYCCSGKHSQSTCHFKSAVCRFCNKRGHITKVCKSRIAQSKAPVSRDSSKATHQVTQACVIQTLPNTHCSPYQVSRPSLFKQMLR